MARSKQKKNTSRPSRIDLRNLRKKKAEEKYWEEYYNSIDPNWENVNWDDMSELDQKIAFYDYLRAKKWLEDEEKTYKLFLKYKKLYKKLLRIKNKIPNLLNSILIPLIPIIEIENHRINLN